MPEACARDRVGKISATKSVSERAKEQASHRPPQQENCQEEISISLDRCRMLLGIFGKVNDFVEHVTAGDVEYLALVDIEDPASRGDYQHQPLVAGNPLVPAAS